MGSTEDKKNGDRRAEQSSHRSDSQGKNIVSLPLDLNAPPPQEGSAVTLWKDNKTICRTKCYNPPLELVPNWSISGILPQTSICPLSGLPQFFLQASPVNSHQRHEWSLFMDFLKEHKRVAIVKFESVVFYILPPDAGATADRAVVAYRDKSDRTAVSNRVKPVASVAVIAGVAYRDKSVGSGRFQQEDLPHAVKEACRSLSGEGKGTFSDKKIGGSGEGVSKINSVKQPLSAKFQEEVVGHCAHGCRDEAHFGSQSMSVPQDNRFGENFVRVDPSYLKTLGRTHLGWAFGAIAELVDNSRDAKATKLDISIDSVYFKLLGQDIPMLSVIDDGHGMSHEELVRMVSFGRKQPVEDNPDHIGRFGVGFKTGAMGLGQEAFVLSQTSVSRSIAFLSQSLNEGKGNLEIPIVSYSRCAQVMELNTTVQSKALSDFNLKLIKEFSPFDEYLIGVKSGLFSEKGTGTQIHIWNLEKWGSEYCLEWQTGGIDDSSCDLGDILIRSRRIRSRPGQISQQVPIDYSLRSYLEVIFLDPRMKISVQGSLVKSRHLARSLNKISFVEDTLLGKPVKLTLGRSQLEWEQINCGMFLYWHGRLIEAYKRVGGMVYNTDMGRGVIGVIDVTNLMNDGNGHVWVHNDKQGFHDCEPYVELEQWLGFWSKIYWDAFDMPEVIRVMPKQVQLNASELCRPQFKTRRTGTGIESDGDSTRRMSKDTVPGLNRPTWTINGSEGKDVRRPKFKRLKEGAARRYNRRR